LHTRDETLVYVAVAQTPPPSHVTLPSRSRCHPHRYTTEITRLPHHSRDNRSTDARPRLNRHTTAANQINQSDLSGTTKPTTQPLHCEVLGHRENTRKALTRGRTNHFVTFIISNQSAFYLQERQLFPSFSSTRKMERFSLTLNCGI